MLGKCLLTIILWGLSLSTSAQTNASLMENLRSRLHAQNKGGAFIKSFPTHSQSYIYDQALAIIAFSKEKDQASAKKLLMALSQVQNQDGSLYFSYYLNGESPYPAEGDKRYAGAIAWVALAAATYQMEFKASEFKKFNSKILNYLSTQMNSVKIKGKEFRGIAFAPTDLSGTDWNENDVAALEHNLDAYAAFYHYSQINEDRKFAAMASELRKFNLALWDDSRSHFWSGVNIKTGVINKQELYLDNQTWSLLALDDSSLKNLNLKDALSMNCDLFLVEHKGILGFMDMKPANRPSKFKFVWSEGSAGQILAMNSFNGLKQENFNCGQHDPLAFLNGIKKMQQDDGGIAYASSNQNPDFSTSSSVAGTTWYYFASNNINPFKVSSSSRLYE